MICTQGHSLSLSLSPCTHMVSLIYCKAKTMRKKPTCSERRGNSLKKKVIIKAYMKEQRDRTKALKLLCGVSGVESSALQGQDKDHIAVTGDGFDPVLLIKLLRKNLDGYAQIISVGPMMRTEGSSSTGNAEASSEVPRGSTPSSSEGTITLEGAPLAINLVELIFDQRSTQPGLARIASLTELSEGCPPMPSDSLALENEELSAEELDQLRIQLCSLTFTSPGTSAPPSSLLDEVSDLLEICSLSKQPQQISDPSKVAIALQCLKRFTRVPFSHLLDPKLQAGLQTCCQILSISQGNQEFIEMSGLVSTYIHVKQSADSDEAQIAVDWKLIEDVQLKASHAKAQMASSYARRDRLIQREAELERELVVVRDAIVANSLEISKAETSLIAITEDLRRVATLGHHINLRERLVTSKRSQCENFWLKFQAMLRKGVGHAELVSVSPVKEGDKKEDSGSGGDQKKK